MKLPIKTIVIAAGITAAGVVAYVVCVSGGGASPAQRTVGKQASAVARPADRNTPKSVPQEAHGRKVAVDVKKVTSNATAKGAGLSPRTTRAAAAEAMRREREAFMKMSPEEQQRFRERKREELRARMRSAHEKGRQDGLRPGSKDAATARADEGDAADRTVRTRPEIEELRAAALKARAEYEESMGEATAAKYRRRSVGHWMNYVRRQRERAAARERQSPSEDKEANVGADAADNQKRQVKTKGKAK